MTRVQAIAFTTALLAAASVAHADSVPDPKIVVAGTGYSQILTSPYFSFTSTGAGGGSFDYLNFSGLDWTELTLAAAMPYGLIDGQWNPLNSEGYYDIGSNLFLSSSVEFGPDDLTIRFWGIDETHPGIPSGTGEVNPFGSHFLIGLDDSPDAPDVGGWLGADHGPLTFDGSASPATLPVPEPASGLLLLGGVLATGLGALRRRGRSRRRS